MRNINYERLLAESQKALKSKKLFYLFVMFGKVTESHELGAITFEESEIILYLICQAILDMTEEKEETTC